MKTELFSDKPTCVCELCDCRQGRLCPLREEPRPVAAHEWAMYLVGLVGMVVVVLV